MLVLSSSQFDPYRTSGRTLDDSFVIDLNVAPAVCVWRTVLRPAPATRAANMSASGQDEIANRRLTSCPSMSASLTYARTPGRKPHSMVVLL